MYIAIGVHDAKEPVGACAVNVLHLELTQQLTVQAEPVDVVTQSAKTDALRRNHMPSATYCPLLFLSSPNSACTTSRIWHDIEVILHPTKSIMMTA